MSAQHTPERKSLGFMHPEHPARQQACAAIAKAIGGAQ